MTLSIHDCLDCGIEYGLAPLPGRHVVSFQMRVLAGVSSEPSDKLGLARILEETLDKGTENYTGRKLSDAFDAIGAGQSSGAGRETITFNCTVLPEHFSRAIELHGELLRRPTFPADAVKVNLNLAKQEFASLQDDPQSIVDKKICGMAFGQLLGRHSLGEIQMVESICRDDLEAFWRSHFHGGRMLLTVAGPVDPSQVADVVESVFSGFGDKQPAGRTPVPASFEPDCIHLDKEVEQEQIGICFPGVDATHDDFPTQQVVLSILSGGMSCRLFTEVREKQGLVYWVGAWQETPRGTGRLFLGASTTPERCDRTLSTLLREVDRLAEDVEQEEIDRAVTGIVSHRQTRGDSTRSHCAELGSDLFFYGRPVPEEEKIAKVRAVTLDDIRRYLAKYPRDPRCVVTLGPKILESVAGAATKSEVGS